MKNKFKNKNVLVLGLGKSGKASLELLKKCGAFCYAFDSDKTKVAQYSGNFDVNILSKIDEYVIKIMDYVILSPSISIFSEPVKLARLFGVKVISELELGSYFVKGKIIGITGTNGKTTTASLVYAILKQAGKPCVLCGNIGEPLTANLLPYKANYVVEMSSFQLESAKKLHVNVGAILNLTPNHLDRHLNFKNYREAKFNIFKNSKKTDKLVLNVADNQLAKLLNKHTKPKIVETNAHSKCRGYFAIGDKVFFANGKVEKLLFDLQGKKLFGLHNMTNILVATAICKSLGIKNGDIKQAIIDFLPLEHRLQFVSNVDGIEFVNDSKSTTPDSTITALKAYDKTPVVLMLGGSDKKTSFDKLAKKIAKSRVKYVCICGDTTKQIATALKKAGFANFGIAKNFEDCFLMANKNAQSGDVVLLSPACASFDFFESFEKRGEEFERLVATLKKK